MKSPIKNEIGSVLLGQIPILKDCIAITRIHKGYSSDQKFVAQLFGGQTYLLKLFDLEDNAAKHAEFAVLRKMKELGVICSQPIEIGKLETLQSGYMILTFIEGNDAREELPQYTENEQFVIGVEAGKELLKMHQYKAPEHIPPWYERKVKKHRSYLEAYKACGVKVKEDKKVISFIEENLGIIKNRPNFFQHDDFHEGNIIVKDRQLAGVIDFNRFDWGDPIHDFLKIGMFSKETSVPFSIGQIAGYHGNKEPQEIFWRLYSLYLAMSVFSSVVCTLKIVPEEMNQMLNRIHGFLEDHLYFENLVPTWYLTD